MFQQSLKDNLQAIFGMTKNVFQVPSEKFEQDTLFIEVESCRSRITQGMAYARVVGRLTTFSQLEKFPYGYFQKKIQLADRLITKDLFFYDVDTEILTSQARFMNITERRTGFVFLYKGQFDPNQGQITSVEFANPNFEILETGDERPINTGDGKVLGV